MGFVMCESGANYSKGTDGGCSDGMETKVCTDHCGLAKRDGRKDGWKNPDGDSL